MSRPSMRYRNGEGPTLVFKDLLGPPVSVEMDFHPNDSELWALFTLLQNAPDILAMLRQVLPELQAYNLIAPSPLLSHLFKKVEELPQEAQLRREYFLRSLSNNPGMVQYSPSRRKVVLPAFTFKPSPLEFK